MNDTVTKRNASTGPYDTNFQVTDTTKQEGIISFSLVQNYRKLAVDVRYLFLRSLPNLSTTQKGLDGEWREMGVNPRLMCMRKWGKYKEVFCVNKGDFE